MASTVTPPPTGTEPARGYTRRSVLRGLGIGSATAVVAGTALMSYRVYDTAVLDPGSGPAHDPWRRWRESRPAARRRPSAADVPRRLPGPRK